MSRAANFLRLALLAGALYFSGVSLLHLLGLKVPGFYIYFNVPSQAYQDRIISLLAFGWAVFLYTAAADPAGQARLIRAVLLAGAGAILGLTLNNLLTDFSTFGVAIAPAIFWLETGTLLLYWLLLLYLTSKIK